MAGQVQMIYIDPPYGIRYGSQTFSRSSAAGRQGPQEIPDLTQEPEMYRTFATPGNLGSTAI